MTRPAVLDRALPVHAGPALLAGAIGVPMTLVTAVLLVLDPVDGPLLAALFAVGTLALVAATAGLLRWPWLAPWPVLIMFATSAELRLRVSASVGVGKDVVVVLLLAVLLVHLVRHPLVLARLKPIAIPLACLGVVVALYLLDPSGTHGGGWVFGTRLLLESLALLAVGMLCGEPARTVEHLVRAMTVVLPFEAAFAWLQQYAGLEALVYVWGYQFGAQVRSTSGDGIRTSGTFEDPFQLAALGVLGLVLALFVASRKQAAVLVAASLAVLAATSVRTAVIQAAILAVVFVVRRGWWRQALTLVGIGTVVGIYLLATTTSAVRPGAPQEPLLFTLNGRSTAWANAVTGPESLVIGNGVGARGIGSSREGIVSAAPAYDPTHAPPAIFAGDLAFLDSAYAQVQSDVGIAGTAALLAGLVGLAVVLARRCRSDPGGASWAAFAVVAVSMVDWIGRSSLASYTTGFLTLYTLGVLVAAGSRTTRP